MNLNPVTLLVVNSLCKITAHYLDFLLDLSINPGDNLSRPILDCYPIRKYGTKRRSCNPSWYKQYRWLEYSSERNCVFCYSCNHFQSGVSHADQAFTTYSFSDWKHATGAFGALAKHDKCHTHRESMLNWAQFLSMKETGTYVANQLNSARQEQVKKNRFYIKSVSEVILSCARMTLH